MNSYSVGFCFDEDVTKVLLINKLRPSHQAGLLNGIGGKIEEGETPIKAMYREAFEEAGLGPEINWFNRGVLIGPEFVCYVYSARELTTFEQKEDEILEIVDLKDLSSKKVIENLKFLIPFCASDDCGYVRLTYND